MHRHEIAAARSSIAQVERGCESSNMIRGRLESLSRVLLSQSPDIRADIHQDYLDNLLLIIDGPDSSTSPRSFIIGIASELSFTLSMMVDDELVELEDAIALAPLSKRIISEIDEISVTTKLT